MGGWNGNNERVVRKVVREEIMGALKKIKGGKAAGMDGTAVKSKNEAICIIDWLLRIFNRCMETGVVLQGWKVACIVPIYKGKGDRREFANYKGISILSKPGKICGRVLISRVMEVRKRRSTAQDAQIRYLY